MAKFRTAAMAMAVAAALAGSQAIAAEGQLSSGKPAGVQAAQGGSPNLLLMTAGVLVTVVAIVVATQSQGSAACGNNCVNPPVTSTI